MKFIIFTKEQAELIKGQYGKYSALDPIELTDGRYGLPPEVLNDPDLSEVHDFLAGLPIEEAEIKVQELPDML